MSETPLEAAVVAVRFVGAPGTVAAAVTVADAFPEMLLIVAMTLPLPVARPAVKVVELPDDERLTLGQCRPTGVVSA